MGSFFFFLCFGLFCVFVQSNLFLHNFVLPMRLDLTIPLTLYIGLSQNPVRGGALVFWLGFLVDIFSGGMLGMHAFLRECMFFLAQILRRGFFLENKILFGALVLVLFFLEGFSIFLLFKLLGKRFFGLEELLKFCFFHGFFTLLVWYALYPLFSNLENMVKKV